ncbi:hypothetical protein C8Q74DRAFT_1256579 [Fomes fomentarius]|nr:hypothetical protein C8Q74DRAFT_1256579 [Fomes fomentarius]
MVSVSLPHEERQITSIDGTFGALLLGTFFSILIYGINIHQTYRYFRSFYSDGVYMKGTVVVLGFGEMLYSILSVHICYHYLVTSYMDEHALWTSIWSFYLLTPALISIVLTTQIFYVRRVYIVGSRSMRTMLIPVMIRMLGGAGFGLALSVELTKHSDIRYWPQLTWLSSGGFPFALVTDVMLTCMMIIYFRTSRTGLKSTETLLNTLIVYTINTGLLTSTLSLCSLVLALALPKDFIFVAVNMCAAHSYVVSVLAVMNSRTSLTAIANATITIDLEIPSSHGRNVIPRCETQMVEALEEDHADAMIDLECLGVQTV